MYVTSMDPSTKNATPNVISVVSIISEYMTKITMQFAPKILPKYFSYKKSRF